MSVILRFKNRLLKNSHLVDYFLSLLYGAKLILLWSSNTNISRAFPSKLLLSFLMAKAEKNCIKRIWPPNPLVFFLWIIFLPSLHALFSDWNAIYSDTPNHGQRRNLRWDERNKKAALNRREKGIHSENPYIIFQDVSVGTVQIPLASHLILLQGLSISAFCILILSRIFFQVLSLRYIYL